MFVYEGSDRAAEFMDISNKNHSKCFFVENDNLTDSSTGIYRSEKCFYNVRLVMK